MKKLIAFTTIALLFSVPAAMGGTEVHHDLQVVLIPERHLLEGIDRITIDNAGKDVIEGFLSPSAEISEITVNGESNDFRFQNGRFRVKAPDPGINGPTTLAIRYQAVFNDPAPRLPANTDNPGFGVTGTISPRGSLLLSGAGWYPHIEGGQAAFELSVDAPGGMSAVTAGRSRGRATVAGRTVSKWEVPRTVEGLSLSVGAYQVVEKDVDGIQIATYFLEANQDLSPGYLAATEKYIRLYQDLFGPYPSAKFAVVENFFPTGYGFPSYTLMGGRVLRLPFIVHTSLGHEIAHCWWGNGVLVDYSGGNWAEGLTAYVADYLYKEKKSDRAALEHRRQLLRNYASLVPPDDDFPAAEFVSRRNPATKAVGYDKVAMIFHMLRIKLGDNVFWETLRDVYRDRLFQKISWKTFKDAFEGRSGISLDRFFDQWLYRIGAPRLSLENVNISGDEGGWTVHGTLRQHDGAFRFNTDLVLYGEKSEIVKNIAVDGTKTRFEIYIPVRPERLVLDPRFNLFRRLDPVELPPTVNSLRGAKDVLVAVDGNDGSRSEAAAVYLATALGLKDYTLQKFRPGEQIDLRDKNILWVGVPASMDGLPPSIGLSPSEFKLNDRVYNRAGDAFFGMFRHPSDQDRVAAVFLPSPDGDFQSVCRKIPHYGKYSYLAFRDGRNTDKGTWPVERSPLIVQWEQ